MDAMLNRQEFWKNIGSSYYTTNWSLDPDRRRFIAQLVKDNCAASVLELGCHDGINLYNILKVSPQVNAVGIDICENAIKQGKIVHKNPADLQVGSLYDLSRFGDKSFDMVFSCGCLIHIPKEGIQGIINEAVRIAKYHIFHLELNGSPEVMKYSENKMPHKMVHSYADLYNNNGIKINARNLNTLGVDNRSGARDLVWANITNKEMKIEKV